MNEINRLLKKLKQDQNALFENFREDVLKMESLKSKRYVHEDFRVLNEIVCRHFKIDHVLVNNRKEEYVAARCVFDFNLRVSGHTLEKIGSETNRDHSTIIHSAINYYSFLKTEAYKNLYLEIEKEYKAYKL
jgi:chromosomal replication initiation ATPase DnaA